MEIIGFFIKDVSAKREEEIKLPLNINNKTSIKEVGEIDVKAINKKSLKISFEFETEYKHQNKKMGEIKISGHILFLHKNHTKILNSWKKEKKLPEDVNIFLVNHILRKCIIKSIVLADELSLPSPVPLPVARAPKKGDTKYIG